MGVLSNLNHNNVDSNEPRIKKLWLPIICMTVVFAVIAVVLLITQNDAGPASEIIEGGLEPMFEFVDEGSRIAEIQALIPKIGLTKESYDYLCKELTKYFDEKYPDEEYFVFVDGTVAIENDDTETSESGDIYDVGNEKTIFELSSSNDHRFKVTIIPGETSDEITVKISELE